VNAIDFGGKRGRARDWCEEDDQREACERRSDHVSPTDALHNQHVTEDRDRVLADASSELAPRARALKFADKLRT